MKYIWKAAVSILLAGSMVAACLPAERTLTPSSPVPVNTESPAAATDQPEIADVPTEAQIIPSEPSQVPTQAEPSGIQTTEIPVKSVEEVLIPVEDLDLAGTLYYPQDHTPSWPGVILIHMLYGERSQWGLFPEQLTAAGFAVLNIDLRGHGETGGEVDWDLAISDLQQVWGYFAGQPDIDQERIAFIGASIGANLALIASSNEPAVRTAVSLSPGLSYAGVETENAMNAYRNRPILIAASQDDAYAANSSTVLEGTAAGESQLIMYQDAGHGTLMLRAEPELAQEITAWLSQYLE